MSKSDIKRSVMWTDECPVQHKCRQNFLHVAKSSLYSKCIISHPFAEKQKLKGPWDGTVKRMKELTWRCEMVNGRCNNACEYCKNCLERFHKPIVSPEKAAMEKNCDPKLSASTCFSYDRMLIGFVTEDRQESTSLAVGDGARMLH